MALFSNTTYSNFTLSVFQSTSSGTATYAAPYKMFIQVGQYRAPSSTQATAPFTIRIVRNGFTVQSGTQTLSTEINSLTASISSRTSAVVNDNTTYTFSIFTNLAIPTTGKIKVILPIEVEIATTATACATLTGTGVISAPTCIYNLT